MTARAEASERLSSEIIASMTSGLSSSALPATFASSTRPDAGCSGSRTPIAAATIATCCRPPRRSRDLIEEMPGGGEPIARRTLETEQSGVARRISV